MQKDNTVVFKSNKDGIVVLLDKQAPFDEIEKTLKDKVTAAKQFFGKTATAITFKGRSLSDEEESKLIGIISQESDLSITYVNNQAHLQHEKTIPEDMQDLLQQAENNMTYFHHGSLRSGQSISHSGSVVVIGDVNPGGEIIAQGNIVILGILKGLVHAGCSGNNNCFISALVMTPPQIRIGTMITYMPAEEQPKKLKNKKIKVNPSLAYIKDGEICIAPLS